jgi:biopolymer transport protein TolQ
MPEALPEALVATEDFSLIALFLRADLIVQAVMAILALASVWSLAVAIDKFFSISGAKSRAKKFEEAFWAGQPMDDLTDRVTDKPAEAMARVFSAGAREWRESRRGVAGDDTNRAIVERATQMMDVAVNRETQRMETGLSTLAIIASSTPFIGLFGTVWGIVNSFTAIDRFDSEAA